MPPHCSPTPCTPPTLPVPPRWWWPRATAVWMPAMWPRQMCLRSSLWQPPTWPPSTMARVLVGGGAAGRGTAGQGGPAGNGGRQGRVVQLQTAFQRRLAQRLLTAPCMCSSNCCTACCTACWTAWPLTRPPAPTHPWPAGDAEDSYKWANTGPCIDVFAPGVDIYSACGGQSRWALGGGRDCGAITTLRNSQCAPHPLHVVLGTVARRKAYAGAPAHHAPG